MKSTMQRRALLGALALIIAGAGLPGCTRKPATQAVPAGATVLALGDSLTSGVGASADTAYPTLLAARTGWNVINAGVSGNTSAQALERLPDLLQAHRPALVIVSIGGNDFLRRLSPETTRTNLRGIGEQARASGAQVLVSISASIPAIDIGGQCLQTVHASVLPLAEVLAIAATISSAAGKKMPASAQPLRYSFDMGAEADRVEAAVAKVLADGLRTADLLGPDGGTPTTTVPPRTAGMSATSKASVI